MVHDLTETPCIIVINPRNRESSTHGLMQCLALLHAVYVVKRSVICNRNIVQSSKITLYGLAAYMQSVEDCGNY
jgi:hypothetical protein